MVTPASNAAAAKRNCPSSSNIVPIRVDVLSEDKTIRVVDTLLFDPTCWPVTLYQPLHAAVEQNATHMAHTILSDAEVQGMGRTVRHFTGRLDLWSPKLQKAIEDQLRPQLWKIATDTIVPKKPSSSSSSSSSSKTTSHLLSISIRLMIDRLVVHENILWDPHGRVSPFEFAQDMAQELNLPEEATVAIATTIVEQLHGLEIDTTPDQSLTIKVKNNNNNNNTGQNTNNSSTNGNNTTAVAGANNKLRGAWMIDPKEHSSIASQVVAQHRSI